MPTDTQRNRFIAACVIAAIVFTASGFGLGTASETRSRDADIEATERAEDARGRSDERSASIDELSIPLLKPAEKAPDVATKGALLASANTTEAIGLGDAFRVDGQVVQVDGAQVVDGFTPTRSDTKGDPPEGSRWLVVDARYTAGAGEERYLTCGTTNFVSAVLSDGSVVVNSIGGDFDPVPEGSFGECGLTAAPVGKAVPYRIALAIPEGATVSGLLVGDLYERTESIIGIDQSEAQGKLGWVRFEDGIDVRDSGDDVKSVGDTEQVT